jgi:hypothetical protein
MIIQYIYMPSFLSFLSRALCVGLRFLVRLLYIYSHAQQTKDGAAGCGSAGEGVSATTANQRYYEIVEPAAALKALELELHKLMADGKAEGVPIDSRATCEALCLLIKQECDAEVLPSFLSSLRTTCSCYGIMDVAQVPQHWEEGWSTATSHSRCLRRVRHEHFMDALCSERWSNDMVVSVPRAAH